MDLYQMEQFKVAAQLQHMTKAAEVLNIAQPALSRTIRSIEKEYGTELFDHVGKRIVLNEKGEILLHYIEEVLESMRTAEQKIHEKVSREERTINLSVRALGMMIDDLIRIFKEESPDTEFHIVQYDTWLLEKEAPDLTLFATIHPYVSENSCTLLREKILLAVPAQSSFAREGKAPLEQILKKPLIGIQNGSDLAANIRYRYKCAGADPMFIMDHYTSVSVADMVSLGMGYAYVPAVTWPGVANDKIALVEVEGADFHRYIHLSWPTSGYMSKAARRFRHFLMEFFAELLMKGE